MMAQAALQPDPSTQVEDASTQGATIVVGGREPAGLKGAYYQPHSDHRCKAKRGRKGLASLMQTGMDLP